jgi:DNA-binding LacI/PurR family transcriptional regulator
MYDYENDTGNDTETVQMRTAKPATIADVAREAGVSVSTVSRILNGKQDVAASTREHVQRVIEALGYSPHAQAQSLRAGKTRNIALLFPLKYPGDLPFDPLDMDFIVGAAAAAGEQDFFFSLLTAPVSRESLLNLYRSAQADGVVLMQVHLQDWRVELLRQHSYPFVMIGHAAENAGLKFVDLDFAKAAETSLQFLYDSGHREVGILGHPALLREEGYGPAVRSWQGYQVALGAFGIKAHFREVSFSSSDVYRNTLELLDEAPGLTAIFTPHAYTALNIVQALVERGRRVPEDCSVIAVTTERIANLCTPPLTHVDFPSHDMGYRAVQMLIRTLKDGAGEQEHVLIPPQLVIRDSTGLAKGFSAQNA